MRLVQTDKMGRVVADHAVGAAGRGHGFRSGRGEAGVYGDDGMGRDRWRRSEAAVRGEGRGEPRAEAVRSVARLGSL